MRIMAISNGWNFKPMNRKTADSNKALIDKYVIMSEAKKGEYL